jgi:glutathione peroxidase
MKNIFLMLLSFTVFLQSCTNQKSEVSKAKTKELMGKTIYDFKVSLDGKEINFADFKGKRY